MKRPDPIPEREEALALFELYKNLLSPHAAELFSEYYEEDLSLAEIAELSGISRAAVHDRLKAAKRRLAGFEEKLGLFAKQKRTYALLAAYKKAQGAEKDAALKSLLEDIGNGI